VRVCINATWVLLGLGMSFASRGSACENRSPATVLCVLNLFAWSPVNGVIADIDEFLCLCLVFRREVKLSSSGFMSAGMLLIFRKTIKRYISRNREIKCNPAVVTAVNQTVIKTLFVSSSVGNIDRQRPMVPASMSLLRRATSTVKT
jgi:hypothetical protein